MKYLYHNIEAIKGVLDLLEEELKRVVIEPQWISNNGKAVYKESVINAPRKARVRTYRIAINDLLMDIEKNIDSKKEEK